MKKIIVFLATSVATLLLLFLTACPPPISSKLEPPEAPGDLAAVAQTHTSIKVTWTDHSGNEDENLPPIRYRV